MSPLASLTHGMHMGRVCQTPVDAFHALLGVPPSPTPAQPTVLLPPSPHRGFDYSGGSWSTLVGKPGLYPLYTDGAGVKLTATIAGGGTDNKSLFIRAVQLTRGGLATTTNLSKVGASWQTAGGRGCCSGDAVCVRAACMGREPSSAAIVALHMR